jgi:hypothetical protein
VLGVLGVKVGSLRGIVGRLGLLRNSSALRRVVGAVKPVVGWDSLAGSF